MPDSATAAIRSMNGAAPGASMCPERVLTPSVVSLSTRSPV
ncbi:MAG: hypothetical protein QM756_02710 [Polyangiaceae bacterium]